MCTHVRFVSRNFLKCNPVCLKINTNHVLSNSDKAMLNWLFVLSILCGVRNKSIKSFFRFEKSALSKVLLKRTSWRLSAFFLKLKKSKKFFSTMHNFWKLSESFVIRSRRPISVLLFFNILLTIRAPYKEQ